MLRITVDGKRPKFQSKENWTRLTFISSFLEVAGIIAMVLATAFFAIYYWQGRKDPACDTGVPVKMKRKLKRSSQTNELLISIWLTEPQRKLLCFF